MYVCISLISSEQVNGIYIYMQCVICSHAAKGIIYTCDSMLT